MAVPIEFGTFPLYFSSDRVCRLRPPYPATNRLENWQQVLTKAVHAVGSHSRPAVEVMLAPSFLEAMGHGYIIPAPFDVQIDLRRDGDQVSLKLNLPADIEGEFLEHWRPFPDGHTSKQIPGSPWNGVEWILKLRGFWYIRTPPGYSCLFVSPQLFSAESLLSLFALPGIIETDRYKNLISFPMIPRRQFPFEIKAGTPLIQAIPFKRRDWQMEIYSFEDEPETFQPPRFEG